MLLEISIKNFAIIEEISLNFEKGMTVLTGETGAGKSIIIDAMNMMLGSRATTDVIRHGAPKAEIEGLFTVESNRHLTALFEEQGLEWTDELIIRREILQNGRSVSRINGQMVNLSVLAPVFAIFIGMILYPFLTPYKQLDAGLTYSSKKLLQYAVILLGFGLNISQVFAVGKSSLPVILSTISIALIIAFFFQRFFNMDTKLATLIGVGSSICGGSAIAATAPVIHAKEKEVAQAISVIFFFNVLAALIFPTLGSWLHLSNEGFALFAGTAVNDTSSVTATASSWDSLYHTNTLESATIVKLTRTLAIIPITLFLSYWQSRQQDNNQGVKLKKIFPVFILYFILASLLTTVLTSFGVSNSFFSPLKQLSKFLIIMAMSAIGLKTNLVAMIKSSGKSILLGALCWIAIILTSLGMQLLIGIF